LRRQLGRNHPLAVIENLGTNDAIGGGALADWQASWARMIATTANVQCVVLTTINTVTDTSDGHGTVAGDINSMIAALAISDGSKYKVVDWNGFLRRQGYPSGLRYIGRDALHPTADGSAWLAARDKSAVDRCRRDHRAARQQRGQN
jgi:hypothetical protein